jgi:hypothetical protein
MNGQPANTILEQLGGNRFIAMTGAREFLELGNGLSFQLPGGGGRIKQGINNVQIIVAENDTYKMYFSRRRGLTFKNIHTFENIYWDQLQEIFTQATGVATSMGTMGRKQA